VHGSVLPVAKDGANLFTDRCAARLTGQQDIITLLLEKLS
jgi:hypothetical protein